MFNVDLFFADLSNAFAAKSWDQIEHIIEQLQEYISQGHNGDTTDCEDMGDTEKEEDKKSPDTY